MGTFDKGYDILSNFTSYQVDLTKVSEDVRKAVESLGYSLDAECDAVRMNVKEIDSVDISWDYVDQQSADFEQLDAETYLNDLIGNFPCYLVVSPLCRWGDIHGIAFTPLLITTIVRDIPAELYLEKTIQGKAIVCKEYSRVNPKGYQVYIIGLTNEERDTLRLKDYDTILDFAERICK